MAKVLIAEDDGALVERISQALQDERLILEIAANGLDAMQLLSLSAFDLLILDWQMPEMSGIEICRRYRATGGKGAVLMMTGRATIDDKAIGFGAGVDDYLSKPFDSRELVMRVRALLRRSQQADTFTYGNITINAKTCDATIDGVSVQLRPKEFALLEFFVRNPEHYFDSNQILDRLWSSNDEVGTDSVRAWVYRLRGKLKEIKNGPQIIHKSGKGYALMQAE